MKELNHLVLVRHGQSEWNAKNLFTGWKDPSLTERGIKEAKNAGEKIKEKNISFDIHFTSELKRAQLTGEIASICITKARSEFPCAQIKIFLFSSK